MSPRTRTTDEEVPDLIDTTAADEALAEETNGNEALAEETNGNSNYTPSRSAIADSVPARTRKSSDYGAWDNEINALRTESLGLAFSYENVPNVNGLAQGLKRVFGVDAETRDNDTNKDSPTKGYGTLWLSFKKMMNADGTLNEDLVTAQKAKYTQ